MTVVSAQIEDIPAWLQLASEVEFLFGPMVDDPRFRQALRRNIERGSAFCVREADGRPGSALLGGVLFSPSAAPRYKVGWLAVAERRRRQGIGRQLVGHVLGLVHPPAEVGVDTFTDDTAQGVAARRFYEHLGFRAAELATGPHGEPVQVFRLLLSETPMARTGPLSLDFVLLTARCRLRCVSEADIPHVFAATRYRGFNDGMIWDAPSSVEELQEPLRKNLAAWAAGTAFTFTIESKSERTLLGRIVLRQASEDGVWSIGYWTHPEHQGKGYMSEAAAAVVDLGFRQLGARRVEAGHAVWNTKSERVLKKLGMKFIRHIPEGFKKQGQWVEENLLAIEKAEWEARASSHPCRS